MGNAGASSNQSSTMSKTFKEPRTFTIGIDIDDTLVDTFEYFQPLVAKLTGQPLEYLVENDISYENTPKEWGMDSFDFAHRFFDDYVPDTPAKEGAAQAVARLRKAGNRIVIITSRTNMLYKDCYYTSRLELSNCGIEYDKLICTVDKGQACKEEKVDIMFDDLVFNCDAVSKVGTMAILFTSKENKNQESAFPRVESWKEALDLLEKLGVPC